MTAFTMTVAELDLAQVVASCCQQSLAIPQNLDFEEKVVSPTYEIWLKSVVTVPVVDYAST
ncbi:hypothetical protein MMUC44124_26770 [Mycolicibacterium mucogenicum DSM 44124]|uniref:Uncharacterized protein n=1 Tax=Mycolicibacterium mucogenicum DSM 44124 TaxID=1226753 RepID=A0A8H2JGJ1_MYCMU|nr:hypothetical protein MMUC44124_26770 [Mycolicibacterium mucogenicum DSM 44124]